MDSLNKKELEDEIVSIGESIAAHNSQMKLHQHALKVDKYLKDLMEKDLNSLESKQNHG